MTMLFALIAMLTFSPASNAATPEDHWTVGHYQVESSYETNGDRRLTIVKDGRSVYSKSMGQFSFLSLSHGKQTGSQPDPVSEDVNADGIPDLVIEHFPKSASCCFGYTIVSLGETPRELAEIDGFPSPMTFEDLNGDRIYEMVGEDWNYYSWYASPRIILRYEKGDYKLATNLMKRSAPTAAQLAAKAAEFQKAPIYNALPVPLEVYRYMLDLIYSGNEKSAWAFLDRVWPAKRPDKQEFIDSFKDQLSKSRFWPEVAHRAD